METLRRLGSSFGRNAMKTVAPTGFQFEDSRRIVKSKGHKMGGDKIVLWVMCLVSAVCWLCAWFRERRHRRALLLAAATRQSSIRELKLALRSPGSESQSLQHEPELLPQLSPMAPSENISVSVHQISGQTVLGPIVVKTSDLVSEIRDKVAEVLKQPLFVLRLVHGSQELDPSMSLACAGVGDGAVLAVVISKERVDVAEKLFARVVGEVWVPDGQRVRAPFSLDWTAYFEATTIRLYDEWVTHKTKRKVKSRREGSGADAGSDSEYEEVETSSWESKEEVQHRQTGMAPHLYIQDAAMEKAKIVFKDASTWARENSALTFQDIQPHVGGGGVLMALVGHERERGIRREERCIALGESLEIVGEACKTEDCLILRDLTVPSDNLHRIDSDGFTGASKLKCKTFQGAVLRNNASLQDFSRRRAVWCRVGKWISGLTFGGLTYLIVRGIWLARSARKRSKKALLQV